MKEPTKVDKRMGEEGSLGLMGLDMKAISKTITLMALVFPNHNIVLKNICRRL